MKECIKCFTKKEDIQFSKNKLYKDGISTICKPCDRLKKQEWRVLNREKSRQANRDSYKRCVPNFTAASARRRASLSQATPGWFESERKEIEQIYIRSKEISDTTGVPHQVDHIIPLKGELVSGLHCLANLQILTATDNLSKSNNFKT